MNVDLDSSKVQFNQQYPELNDPAAGFDATFTQKNNAKTLTQLLVVDKVEKVRMNRASKGDLSNNIANPS